MLSSIKTDHKVIVMNLKGAEIAVFGLMGLVETLNVTPLFNLI